MVPLVQSAKGEGAVRLALLFIARLLSIAVGSCSDMTKGVRSRADLCACRVDSFCRKKTRTRRQQQRQSQPSRRRRPRRRWRAQQQHPCHASTRSPRAL